MAARKPTAAAIRRATPLTRMRAALPNPLACCNLCGQSSAELRAHRECDEFDRPLDGVESLVFVAADHPRCLKLVDAHPRLYERHRGEPGAFPALCGPCTFRPIGALSCTHPELKANGGPGLMIKLDGVHGHATVAGPDGRGRRHVSLLGEARECAGRQERADG
jgi:hypothetical protein